MCQLPCFLDGKPKAGIPGWRSGLAPAFGPGRVPGDPGSNPTSGSRCMEPASPSACDSLSLSLCDYHKKMNCKIKNKICGEESNCTGLLYMSVINRFS